VGATPQVPAAVQRLSEGMGHAPKVSSSSKVTSSSKVNSADNFATGSLEEVREK